MKVLLSACLVIFLAIFLVPTQAQEGVQVSGGTSGDSSERLKAIPISKKAGQKMRSVISLDPSRVGGISDGSSIKANGEVEVSVTCLEPMSQCQGKIYSFSPDVKGRLILGNSAKDARGKAISKWTKVECSQDLPNRNHHCVITVSGETQVRDASKLDCKHRCNVNLVLTAWHGSAKKGNLLVIGTDEDGGRSAHDKGRVNAAVFTPGPSPRVETLRTVQEKRKKVSLRNSTKKRDVLYSLRLGKLHKGEKVFVNALAKAKVDHLRSNVLLQSQMVLSEKPGSVSRGGIPNKAATITAQVTEENGFNCTRGHSGFSSPCKIKHQGFIEMKYDSRSKTVRGEGRWVPLYVNFVLANKAQYGANPRPGDKIKILDGGFIEAKRYN